MKSIYALVAFACLSLACLAQTNAPTTITPVLLKKITADVEALVPASKMRYTQQGYSKEAIEFAIDTFCIEQLLARKIDLDYSTAGMTQSTYEMAAAYDKLMNKYYAKLLHILAPQDKKILIAAQKAWLAYREAEAKLIGTLCKEQYSGGGTIQGNIAASNYASVVQQRAIDLFSYYDSVAGVE